MDTAFFIVCKNILIFLLVLLKRRIQTEYLNALRKGITSAMEWADLAA